MLWHIPFARNSLWSAEHCYGNIECEAFEILHGLEKSHYYCFTRVVCVITDHKLVAILNKDVEMLSQWLVVLLVVLSQHFTSLLFGPFYCILSHQYEEEPSPPRSTPWGVYRSGSHTLNAVNFESYAFTDIHPSNPTSHAGRSMVLGHVLIVHLSSFVCTCHIGMTIHSWAF